MATHAFSASASYCAQPGLKQALCRVMPLSQTVCEEGGAGW